MQRRLTALGFDTRATGAFDASTRSVIKRCQAARGYPESGFLNKHQHKALVDEVAPPRTAAAEDEEERPRRPRRRRSGSGGGAPNPFQALQPVGRAIFGR